MRPQNPNPNNDVMMPDMPKDSVSALRFSMMGGGAQYLACSTWDGVLTCYEHTGQGQTKVAAQQKHPTGSPALCVDWSDDWSKMFAGFGDNSACVLRATSVICTRTTHGTCMPVP